MGKKICPSCDGEGWYVDDEGKEVNPCDYEGCDGDGFVVTAV
jgi:hypothetical protein